MRAKIFLLLFLLGGCAAKREYPAFPPTDPSNIEVVDRLYVGLIPLGHVRGVACDRGLIDRRKASHAEALMAAKEEAASRGASGIAAIRTSAVRSVFPCQGLSGRAVRAEAYRKSENSSF